MNILELINVEPIDTGSCIKMDFRYQMINWYCLVGSRLNNQFTGIRIRNDAASFLSTLFCASITDNGEFEHN